MGDALELQDERDREISVRQDLDKFGHIEPKDVSVVDKFKQMFTEGKVTGQIRSIYAGYKQKQIAQRIHTQQP